MRQMSSISLPGQVRTTGRDWGESWIRVVGETLNSQLWTPNSQVSIGPSEQREEGTLGFWGAYAQNWQFKCNVRFPWLLSLMDGVSIKVGNGVGDCA